MFKGIGSAVQGNVFTLVISAYIMMSFSVSLKKNHRTQTANSDGNN